MQKAKFVNENDGSRHFGHGTAAGRFNVNRSQRKVFNDFGIDADVSHDVSYYLSISKVSINDGHFRIYADSLWWTVSYLLTLFDILICKCFPAWLCECVCAVTR